MWEVPSSHVARNICRLKSCPVLHNFLFVNLNCKNSAAKKVLLPVRKFPMQSTAGWCLSVCLATEQAEEEQRGKAES